MRKRGHLKHKKKGRRRIRLHTNPPMLPRNVERRMYAALLSEISKQVKKVKDEEDTES